MGKSIQERLAAMDNEIVSEKGYTRAQLNEAFKLVQDPGDWKAPINAIIAGHPTTKEKVAEAIMFYTATVATFTDLDNSRCRVNADGYRIGPAGDH